MKKYIIRDYIFYFIYLLIILTISYFLNKLVQMLMFVVLFECIQNAFSKRFHAETIIDKPITALRMCKIITIVVEILYLIYCKDLKVSIYNNLFVIFVMSFTNALLQFFCERTIINKTLLSNLDNLNYLCDEFNITDLAKERLIMRYVKKMSIKEIAEIEFTEEETIKQSIRRSKRKMGI